MQRESSSVYIIEWFGLDKLLVLLKLVFSLMFLRNPLFHMNKSILQQGAPSALHSQTSAG